MEKGPVTFDTVLDLCGDFHRRIVLGVLVSEQRTLTLQDLVKALVKHNHHIPSDEVSGEVLTRLHRSLYHLHIPKIAAAGLVEFDTERELVAVTPRFEPMRDPFESVIDADPQLELPLEL